jgi:hypothetical protein
MVWRPSYQTLVAHDVPLPPFGHPTDILVGGFDFSALREMSIWRRLAMADAAKKRYLEAIFLPSPSPADQEMLETIVPPSNLATTLLLPDPGETWQQLIQPSDPQECFAAAIQGDQAVIVMKGLPTEEAWDAFLEALG